MRRLVTVCLIAGSALCLTVGSARSQSHQGSLDDGMDVVMPDSSMLDGYLARDAQATPTAKPTPPPLSPLLIYHGGPVMAAVVVVQPIFWGASWVSDPSNKKGWLDTFYRGLDGSRYIGTNGEYTDLTGSHVGSAVVVGQEITDTSPAPHHARTSTVLQEVCRLIASPVSNGYYPVYVDTPRGHARYCAWHSAGTCNLVTVQFAFFFNLDGDPGCDPGSTATAYSQGVAALANMSGAQLSATVTNPHGDGWYDANGAENWAKCAWTFGHPLLTLSNGTQWKIQGNFSNAASDAGSGYDGSGCIDGE